MKDIKLTYNQSKALIINDKKIRVKKDGAIYYIELLRSGLCVTNWLGNEVPIKVILDECFESYI